MHPAAIDAWETRDVAAARAARDAWANQPLASGSWDSTTTRVKTTASNKPNFSSKSGAVMEKVAESSWERTSIQAPAWDGQPPAWDAEPTQQVNLTSNLHASEFPGTFCWTSKDALAATFVKFNAGSTNYLRGDEVGVGGFARVYKVMRQTDSRIFAGKTMPEPQKLVQEARKLKILTHEHLLKYEGWYAESRKPENTMLLTELCGGGSLGEHIDYICTSMIPGDILKVVAQISGALGYLHNLKLFHSDVKPKNIFVRSFKDMNVVLGDCADVKPFGYKGEKLGTEGFYSPDMVARKQHCGYPDDIWALGVTILGMMAQYPRVEYEQVPGQRKDKRRIDKYPGECFEHAQNLVNLNPENGVAKLLARMLAWKPEERATAAEVKATAEGLVGVWEKREALDMKVPEGFQPIEFW